MDQTTYTPEQLKLIEEHLEIVDEYCRRTEKERQSKYGWYDDKGKRQGGLISFVRYFWKELEPDRKLVDGWPLWAMCEHLEAVTRGEVTRLLINVPPGFMKSMLVDVFWPAWEWGPMEKPFYRYVAFSYSAHLTERDNDKFRTLVTSKAYQRLYGSLKVSAEGEGEYEEVDKETGVTLRNKTTIKVMNTRTGWKFASSVGGIGTGERGDRVIIDDPHNVKDSESEIVRNETTRWFRESISSRFNDLDAGALIIIMQRVHYDDLSGVALSLGVNYAHLMIPWEYEPGMALDARGEPRENLIGWTDPREEEGEPAWPDRFPLEGMARQRIEVGPYAWAGQFQQSPVPRGEGIFLRKWWQPWEAPDNKFPVFSYIVASLDGAFTEKETNDPSALTVWGIFEDPENKQDRIMLVHAWRKHLKFSGTYQEKGVKESVAAFTLRTQKEWGLLEWVAHTCDRFKVDLLLIEGAGPGLSAAQALQSRFGSVKNWGIHVVKVKGDKVARAYAAQPTFSQLMVHAPDREWAEQVIEEMETFPLGKYDDLTDSATQAINFLRGMGRAPAHEEVAHAHAELDRHRPKPKALYPC